MELIETSTFTRQITALLSDEEYREFQSRLAARLTPRQVAQLAKVVKDEFSNEVEDV